jgi:mono/diheme cytochrome c family protein
LSRSRAGQPGWVFKAVATCAVLIFAASIGAAEPAGQSVFAGHCAVCHGPEAAGIPGAFPPLREQIATFAKTSEGRDYLVMVVTTGLIGNLKLAGTPYLGVMPAQFGLTETDVAAVLSYLASARGTLDAAPSVSVGDVAAARGRHPDKTPQATRALRPAYPDS